MYRGSQESFAETIERLEAELAEMRGLSRSPRWRMRALSAVTALCVLSSGLLGVACLASHARAEALERHMSEAARVMETRRQDLGTCVSLAEQSERAATQCKVVLHDLEPQKDPSFEKPDLIAWRDAVEKAGADR